VATVTTNYAASAALTWTPESLANAAYDFSAAVDNTTNKYVDALVSGKLTTGTSPTNGNIITIYAYAEDGNGQYSAGISGTDGGTPGAGEQTNLPVIATIIVDATSNHTYEWGPISLAQFFGGVLPPKWGIGCLNGSGVALNATGSNQAARYQGVKYDVA
jgi:hypothetical protein